MTSYSDHYGLIKLGPGDQYSAEDYAFSQRNIDSIDSKMYLGAEAHKHDGLSVTQLNPVAGPYATLLPGGGTIPGGRTIKYKYTYVDAYGAETAASPVTTVSTPLAVSTPGAPSLTALSTGGTLLPGNFFYAVTAYVNNINQETLVGARGYQTLYTGSTNKITLTFPSLPSGATGFNVYRRSPGSTRFQYLTSVNFNVATPSTTFVDTGAIAEDCNRTTPTSNNTASSNGVSLSLPGATPTVPAGYTWKLYRSYSDDFNSSLLSWVVTETSEGSGVIVPTFTDIGTGTTAGLPPTVSELVASPSKINLTGGAEVTGTLPQGYTVGTGVITFAEPGPLSVEAGRFVWTCEWDQAILSKVRIRLGKGVTASSNVTVDVQKYNTSLATPVWQSVLSTLPTIAAGQSVATGVVNTSAFGTRHVVGDIFVVDITAAGASATPTEADMVITLTFVYKSGSETVSLDWAW